MQQPLPASKGLEALQVSFPTRSKITKTASGAAAVAHSFDSPFQLTAWIDTSHVPCKFFRQGACQAGNACPFSHDLGAAADNICKYFAKVSPPLMPTPNPQIPSCT
jgi:hypothetical protein